MVSPHNFWFCDLEVAIRSARNGSEDGTRRYVMFVRSNLAKPFLVTKDRTTATFKHDHVACAYLNGQEVEL